MLLEKRIHKRFEVFVVVGIKSLRAPDNFYLGITKNFSIDGFSFESQSMDLEVGENIEFKFKHSQDSSYVFNAGQIVWKKKDNKFNCFMGVQFTEIDQATKNKMLEIVSYAGDIPVDSFLSDKGDKDINVEETEATDHEFIVDESETTSQVEEVDDETLESDIEEVDDTVLHMDSGHTTYDDTSPVKKDLSKKAWLYIPIAMAILVILFMIFKDSNNISKSLTPVFTKSATHEDINKKDSIPAVAAQTGNVEYYLQVGAWKYLNNAQAILLKLKRNYPGTYIKVENNLHKVRIPEIMNKKQGANISKDIEDKFNIKPILVLKTK